jgi:voltage-gated potassium channel
MAKSCIDVRRFNFRAVFNGAYSVAVSPVSNNANGAEGTDLQGNLGISPLGAGTAGDRDTPQVAQVFAQQVDATNSNIRRTMPVFMTAKVLKTVYAHFARLSWDALVLLFALHVLVAYSVLRVLEAGEITEGIAFWYYYVTTATTIGYGDIAPKTPGGRLFTTLWIMPGGIMLFTVSIAKFLKFIADLWRKRMRGQADYSHLEDHIVILGWQGLRTQRMIDEIVADTGAVKREIVLCTTKEIENPMPDTVKFVRDKEFSESALHRRAGTARAAIVIVLGHDDHDTLAGALAAASLNKIGHIVAHFEQQSVADLLSAHCPRAESMVSLSIEMMVRAALDPGSSHVQRDLLSVFGGQNNFSMRVPDNAPALHYGHVLKMLKENHDATLIAMADDSSGKGLHPNAAMDAQVAPGTVLYYIAARRIDPSAVTWSTVAVESR